MDSGIVLFVDTMETRELKITHENLPCCLCFFSLKKTLSILPSNFLIVKKAELPSTYFDRTEYYCQIYCASTELAYFH